MPEAGEESWRPVKQYFPHLGQSPGKKKAKMPTCQGGVVEECNKYWLERKNWEADCGRILNLNQTPEHCQSDSPTSSVSESLMRRVRKEDRDPSVLRSVFIRLLSMFNTLRRM